MISQRNAGFALLVSTIVVGFVYLLVSLLIHLNKSREQALTELVENTFFEACAKDKANIEYRRTCSRAAYAYANGKLDYEAYGKTITWDKEARIYVIKEETK